MRLYSYIHKSWYRRWMVASPYKGPFWWECGGSPGRKPPAGKLSKAPRASVLLLRISTIDFLSWASRRVVGSHLPRTTRTALPTAHIVGTTVGSLIQAASRSKSARPGIVLQGCHAMYLVRNGPLLPPNPNCCEGDWLRYSICLGCALNSSWMFCESISCVELLSTKSQIAQGRVVWIQLYRQVVGGHMLYMSSIISIELNTSRKFEHTWCQLVTCDVSDVCSIHSKLIHAISKGFRPENANHDFSSLINGNMAKVLSLNAEHVNCLTWRITSNPAYVCICQILSNVQYNVTLINQIPWHRMSCHILRCHDGHAPQRHAVGVSSSHSDSRRYTTWHGDFSK